MIERSKYYTTADPPACSCPDWQYRGHIRPCKHIRRLQEAEALIASNRAQWVEREATD